MSEAVSVLDGAVSDSGIAKVSEAGLCGMITLRGDLGSKPFTAAVKKVTGLAVPDLRRIVQGDKAALAWMSPDELLLMVSYEEADAMVAALGSALAGVHHLAVNVSDARAVLGLSGPNAREVLAKVAPVDLDPSVFGPGEFRRTRMAQIPAAVWMASDDEIRVICFRSVAGYAFKLLTVAAQPGSNVGVYA